MKFEHKPSNLSIKFCSQFNKIIGVSGKKNVDISKFVRNLALIYIFFETSYGLSTFRVFSMMLKNGSFYGNS